LRGACGRPNISAEILRSGVAISFSLPHTPPGETGRAGFVLSQEDAVRLVQWLMFWVEDDD
jgi:hypothetical protein